MEIDIGLERPDISFDKDIIIDPIARRILENIPVEMRKTTLRAMYCALEKCEKDDESIDFVRITLAGGYAVFLSMNSFDRTEYSEKYADEFVIMGAINDGENTISDNQTNIVMPKAVVSSLSGEFPLSHLVESPFTKGVNAVVSDTFESDGKTAGRLIVVRDEMKISSFLPKWIGDVSI